MSRKAILAPRGFPWRAVFAGAATITVCMVVALGAIGATSTGGAFVVSGLIGIGVFAANLG
jgi:hypothetical protein